MFILKKGVRLVPRIYWSFCDTFIGNRIARSALCKDCPVGMYCVKPTDGLLSQIRNYAISVFENLEEPITIAPCACIGMLEGTFFMDVVAGCDPRLARQFKPPVCHPCPEGKACPDPFSIINCPVGTYAAANFGGCTPCDTSPCPPGYYRPKGQCQVAGLYDPYGQRMWDRCATCTTCTEGSVPAKHDQVNGICGVASDPTENTCGVVCRPDYYITLKNTDGGVVCKPCTPCPQGSMPLDTETCDGTTLRDVQCEPAGLIAGQQQTTCPNFFGVFMDMVSDGPDGDRTGDETIFDAAGSTASTPDYILYEYRGWCLYAVPFGSQDVSQKRRLLGSKRLSAPFSSVDCGDFSSSFRQSFSSGSVDESFIEREFNMKPLGEPFIFGDMTSLTYDYRSGYLFMVVTTYDFTGTPGANTALSMTNRHDEILAIDMGRCLGSTSIIGCESRRVVDTSVWQVIYGGDGTRRLNEFGVQGRGILDITILNRDSQDPSGSVYVVMAQADGAVTSMRCARVSATQISFPCTTHWHYKSGIVYSNLAGSVVSDGILYASIRTDQGVGVTGINNTCVIDRINTNLSPPSQVHTHVLINACDPEDNDFIVDLQIAAAFPNWLWITRREGVWSFDITDTDAFVTDFQIGDLDLLSKNSEILDRGNIIDTDPNRLNYNVTFPPTRTGIAVHMDTGHHWYPDCKRCPYDRYQVQ